MLTLRMVKAIRKVGRFTNWVTSSQTEQAVCVAQIFAHGLEHTLSDHGLPYRASPER
jgi:hypothetical protein